MGSAAEEANNVLANTKKLASYNMLLQLSFRVLTFITNAVILRFITCDVLGVVNVRLLLLYNTILFMSREAFRRACLSGNESRKGRWRLTINLLWCAFPIGVLYSLALSYVWTNLLESPQSNDVPHYPTAVLLFAFSACIELAIEPLWLTSQIFQFVKLKAVVEGVAMLVKCSLTILLITWKPEWGLLCFCYAQIMHSLALILSYYGYYTWFIRNGHVKKIDEFPFKDVRDFFPNFTTINNSLIDQPAAKLTWSFFRQSFLKQILTEGERYVMTVLNVLSFADQGVYDVINNLGSLAARFIFLPLEESYYTFFAKLLTRGKTANGHDKERIGIISNALFDLLRLVVLIGGVILAFGFPYSTLLLDLYGGSILTSGTGPALLRAYCVYVLLIAINGTTECFVFASMDQTQIDGYNKKMFVFSFIFLASSYYLTNSIGSIGFIIANCFNMATRITHSVYYIHRFYKESTIKPNPLSGIIPSKLMILTLFMVSLICCASERYYSTKYLLWKIPIVHVVVGAACFIITAAVVYLKEPQLVKNLKDQFISRKPVKHDKIL